MRSEVKKLLEGASGEELKSYIGQDRSVSLEELQLWMLRVVYVEESGAANGDVIKNAAAIHGDGYDTTKLIRSLTEQQLRVLGLKGGHAALLLIYTSGSTVPTAKADPGSPSSGDTSASAEMSQTVHSISSAISEAATASASMLAESMLAATRMQARSAGEQLKVSSLSWDTAKPGAINVASLEIWTEQVRRKHARVGDGTAEAITAVMKGDPALVPIEEIAAKLDLEADGALYRTIQNTVSREVLHAHGNPSAVAEAARPSSTAGCLASAQQPVESKHCTNSGTMRASYAQRWHQWWPHSLKTRCRARHGQGPTSPPSSRRGKPSSVRCSIPL
jgi:hypothetical protein